MRTSVAVNGRISSYFLVKLLSVFVMYQTSGLWVILAPVASPYLIRYCIIYSDIVSFHEVDIGMRHMVKKISRYNSAESYQTRAKLCRNDI